MGFFCSHTNIQAPQQRHLPVALGHSAACDSQDAADPCSLPPCQESGAAGSLTLPDYLFTEPKLGFLANWQNKGQRTMVS